MVVSILVAKISKRPTISLGLLKEDDVVARGTWLVRECVQRCPSI